VRAGVFQEWLWNRPALFREMTITTGPKTGFRFFPVAEGHVAGFPWLHTDIRSPSVLWCTAREPLHNARRRSLAVDACVGAAAVDPLSSGLDSSCCVELP